MRGRCSINVEFQLYAYKDRLFSTVQIFTIIASIHRTHTAGLETLLSYKIKQKIVKELTDQWNKTYSKLSHFVSHFSYYWRNQLCDKFDFLRNLKYLQLNCNRHSVTKNKMLIYKGMY